MRRQFIVLTAALAAIACLLVSLPGRGAGEEQTKPEKQQPASTSAETDKDSSTKSHLRTGREAIEKSLAEKVDLDVKDLTLDEAIRRIRMKQHVQIQFDVNALKDAAIDPTGVNVTLQVKDIPLRSALKLMLSQFNLTTINQDEVLQITTKDAANNKLLTHVYDVREVLPRGGDKNEADFDSLIDLITSNIAAQSWSSVGGPGTISGLEPAMLVVAQTEEVHNELASMLAMLASANAELKAGKYDVINSADFNEAEQRINKALSENADFDFHDTPLKQVAEEVQKRHAVQIQFDLNALKDATIDPAELHVTYSAKGISLHSALRAMLSRNYLTAIVEDNVLVVTTKDNANQKLRTAVYPVEDLANRQSDPSAPDQRGSPDLDSLINLITSNIAAQSWSDVGGPGTIGAYDKIGAALVVSQTQEVHEQIPDLLSQLREVRQKQKDSGERTDDKPQDPNAMVLRVYNLRVSAPNDPAMSSQEVMDVVKGLVEPKSWGQGDAFLRGATAKLIVRQTPAVHAEVKKLLDKIGASAPVLGGGMGGVRGRRAGGGQPNGPMGGGGF